MAGGEPSDIPKLTGLTKYFNSYTVNGRKNIVIATYATVGLGLAYYKLKSKKDPK